MLDNREEHHQYHQEKKKPNIICGIVFLFISIGLIIVAVGENSENSVVMVYIGVYMLTVSIIGICCCIAHQNKEQERKKQYKEQMQNQFYQNTPIITYNDQQYLPQNKQPLIQNQQYIQYPNHPPISHFPQMYQNQQNGYLPHQQQNYQQQDLLIHSSQLPQVDDCPAQDAKETI